jgi:hypothetical protein
LAQNAAVMRGSDLPYVGPASRKSERFTGSEPAASSPARQWSRGPWPGQGARRQAHRANRVLTA